jgi:DNA-binding MarR family transcriptional regulator
MNGTRPARPWSWAELPLASHGERHEIAGNGSEMMARDNGAMPANDEVDRIVGAWTRERPDLDFTPLQVLSRVGRLARHLERARRAAFSASDLELWEFDVLSALRRAGDPYQLSPKALLQQTLVSSGTMTNRIDRLVERMLVERRTDPNDGRGILVVMTERGRDRVDSAISLLLQGESELLDGLSQADQDRLSGLLRKLSLDFD